MKWIKPSKVYHITLMEKKKLLESVSKSFKTKEELILSAVFLKVKGDPTSSRLFELYDRSIVYYTVH